MRFDVHPTTMKQKQGASTRTHPENPQTRAICTTGRSPSGSLCFLYSGRNCVKLTQFLLVRFKQGLGWDRICKA